MLNKLPVKKEHLLIVATILLLLISYRFAFKNTLEAWQLNTQLKQQLTQPDNIDYQPGYLERKQRNIEVILKRYQVDTLNYRNAMIDDIALVAERENVKLVSVPVNNDNTASKYVLQKMVFEGDYYSLMRTMNKIEQGGNIGIIRSSHLMTKKLDYSKPDNKQLLEIYFINMKKK